MRKIIVSAQVSMDGVMQAPTGRRLFETMAYWDAPVEALHPSMVALGLASCGTVRARTSGGLGFPVQDERDGIAGSRFSVLIHQEATVSGNGILRVSAGARVQMD